MQELDLTIFERGIGKELILPLLAEFESQHKVHVNLELLHWESGWSQLVGVALYGHGPDLSEVGSTWVMDFVRMNAVGHLKPNEVMRLGGENEFFPMNWRSGVVPAKGDEPQTTCAIPWTSDVRLAYYRRDLFEKAGLDPAQVFGRTHALPTAIEALKASGVELPLAFSTQRSRNDLHLMASWLWDMGGDFLTPDGSRVAFDSPQGLHGMKHYFELGQYIPEARRRMDDAEADQLFLSGDAAIVFSGWWLLTDAHMAPVVRENLGVVAMPGGSFVGGTHLLPWKHSRNREQAILLAEFLVKRSAEFNIFPPYSLPAYIPSWEMIKFLDAPYLSVVLDALKKGRGFSIGQLWGLVEKRLTDAMPIVWDKVFDSGVDSVGQVLDETIVPLAHRINITME